MFCCGQTPESAVDILLSRFKFFMIVFLQKPLWTRATKSPSKMEANHNMAYLSKGFTFGKQTITKEAISKMGYEGQLFLSLVESF